ncbi:MAG: hypothetical protein V8R81_09840 [Clostridia bacterium]
MQEIVKNNKRHKEKNIVKKQTGITLIALVITIIVLLILAGVSIAMLTGNNGILTQANQAKENNNSAAAKEKVQVEALGSIDKSGKFNEGTFEENVTKNIKGSTVRKSGNSLIVTVDGYDVTVNGTTGEVTGVAKSNGEKPSTGVTPGTEVSKTEKDNYTDSNKEKATIPKGFTVDETENTISSGLVVHGPDGSEFVWIPVTDINNMSQCSTAGGNCNLQLDGDTLKCTTHNSEDIVGKLYATELYKNSIDDTANKTYSVDSELREPAYLTNSSYGDASSYNTIGLKLSDMQRDYRNMAAKVAKYGGFYVGRYETSLSNATSTEAKDGDVQSKPGVIPTSAANSATSRWYGLYKIQDKTYTGKNGSVESSMIWGSQYDAIINWVKNGNNETEKAKLTNSLGNNSGGNVKTTGNNTYANDSINNIRDLGGNLSEWTLEAYNTYGRVIRGGYYNDTSSPSYRYGSHPYGTNSNSGSRVTLYIK